MHAFGCADDGIDRACLYAERAADAPVFVDQCGGRRLLDAICGIERYDVASEERGKLSDALRSPGWALIDLSLAVGDGFRIRTAAAEAALRALRLRQKIIDAVGQ